MAEKRVTATLVIDFSRQTAEAEGNLILEIDDRDPPQGLNGGNTDFRPGDSPAYLLYRAANVTLLEHATTAGAIAQSGGGSRLIEETLTFSDSREASLRYPVAGAFSSNWIGRNGGTVSLHNQNAVLIPMVTFGILKVTYLASFTAYRLTNVPLGIDQVLIWAIGRTA